MKLDVRELIEDLPEDVDYKKVISILAKAADCNFDSVTTFMLVYKEVMGDTLCKKYCNWMVDNMHHGTEHGRKWTVEQTNELARKNSIDFGSDYTEFEFNAVVHMMYYDYHSDVKDSGISGESIFAKMADSYLTDEDAPKGRLLNHFFFIVRE
ncbi:hypothetical protein [Treponema sp.]|uniref:DUF7841 family protein n=1 Tax=Treponema sp. TaxID=166 RepID=UPI00298D9479|nr:hypothetical protein [Treponema sp.]MCQ2242039.1 hypothetical protein [Treponema sp.]